jgi:hypothetical protein
MIQRAVRSQRWLTRQQSSLTLPELGVFEFLVLCFEQVSVAGAAMNCFQAVPQGSSGSDSDNNSGNAPLFLPAVEQVIPQALMVMAVFSLSIVCGSQVARWMLRTLGLECASKVTFVARRRHLPPVIALLKLFFLLYVILRLNGSAGLQWKEQTSALCAALILVICEVVDVFAVAHTWVESWWRGVTVHDWREQDDSGVNAKQLVLTFVDRWKDCGLVTSFLSQGEMILLVTEIPSMAWGSWTCCQRGSTPEHLSYQLHRMLTVLTIVMGMNVVLVASELEDDVVGATIFLIADFVLTSLRLFEGRHRRRARRDNVRAQRLTMMTAADIGASSYQQDEAEDEPEDAAEAASCDASKSESSRDSSERTTVSSRHTAPQRSSSVLKQWWDLKRQGIWKSTVLHEVSSKEWAFAALDCIYSISVVLNFYETADGAKVQVMPGLLAASETGTASTADDSEEELMGEVNRVAMVLSSGFWAILGLSLAARHYFLFSSRRQRVPGAPHYFPMDGTAAAAGRKPNHFALGVEGVKVALLPASICICVYVLAQANWFVIKQGVNVLVAGSIGAIAAARSIDAVSQALYGRGRFDGDLPGLEMFGGSPYVKASTALQVFWDRFNDFLGPLSIVHLVVSSSNASKNFIVFHFLVCVCVLHAVIAYVDVLDTKSSMHRAERLGYLVAVTFLVRNSQKYVERQGSDLYAPVLLVAIEFFVQDWAIASCWKAWHAKKKTRVPAREFPMLSSEPDETPILGSSEDGTHVNHARSERASSEEGRCSALDAEYHRM